MKDDLEKKYELIINNTSDLISIIEFNLKLKFIYLSPSHKNSLGYDVSDLLGKSVLDYIHPDDSKKIIALLKKNLKEKAKQVFANKKKSAHEEIIFRFRHKNGQWHYLKSNIDLVGKQIIIISHDVTGEQRTKEKLKKERDRFKQYIDIAGVILLTLDKKGNVLLINKKGCEVLGYSQKELIGQNWMEKIIRPEDLEELKKVHKITISGKFNYYHHDNIVLTKNREEKIISWNNTFLKNEQGQIIGSLSSGEEITEKRKKDLALKQAAEEWLDTFNSMSDGVSIHDNDFTILNANKVVCEMLGKSKQEVIGSKCFNLFHGLKEPIEICPLVKSKKTGKKESIEYYEKTIDKWLFVTVSPIKKEGKAIRYIHIVRDVTSRKKADFEMKKQNKELQQFNKLAVSRELKMIELKRKIAKLEKIINFKNDKA